MGCSASKPVAHPTRNSEHCSSASPSVNSSPAVGRAFSLPTPLVHHPPVKKGDTHHLVSLTSTTYGSLLLIDRPKTPHLSGWDRNDKPQTQPLDTKIGKSMDSEQSLSPDSVINTWELMDGLDDLDFDSEKSVKANQTKSSSYGGNGFDGCVKKLSQASAGSIKSSEIDEEISSLSSWSPKKPLWQHISEEYFLAKLDPNVASTYMRALSSRQLCTDQHNKSTTTLGSSRLSSSFSNNWSNFPGTQDRILIYFTSLRGIRKTYEDCCLVRMIFRGLRVSVDERDISMDSFYKKELQAKLGGKAVSLPQVFIKGKHIGGAEEIKQLNEAGELANILEDFPVTDPASVCDSCGDARFVPCPNCNGSRKLFKEDGELRRCPDCNENGLIRCPLCC